MGRKNCVEEIQRGIRKILEVICQLYTEEGVKIEVSGYGYFLLPTWINGVVRGGQIVEVLGLLWGKIGTS